MEELEEKNTCFQISDFISFSDVPTLTPELTKKEKRAILMHEIYDFYKAEYDKRRKENWKRYCKSLKEHRIDEKILGREKTFSKFMKSKNAIKELTYERLSWLMNYLPLNDLPYFISTAREFSNTGKNFTSWLSIQIFAKEKRTF